MSHSLEDTAHLGGKNRIMSVTQSRVMGAYFWLHCSGRKESRKLDREVGLGHIP